jgi:hypothetical protein
MLLKLIFIFFIIFIINNYYNITEKFGGISSPRVYDWFNQWGFRNNNNWVFSKNYYYPLSNNYNAIYQHLTPELNNRLLLNSRWYDGSNMYRIIPNY